MEKLLSRSAPGIAVFFALIMVCASFAHAEERHGRREIERDRYRTPHWVFDDRFHHNHYYPSPGYSISVLPAGNIALRFRGAPFFFRSGVWYRPAGPGFIVARPPFGIVVPILPPSYSTVLVGRVPYYYANDVYYEQAPGGYAVVAPPADAVETAPPAPMDPPPPQAGMPGAAPQSSTSASWYYCESSKTYYPYVSECREGWRAVPAVPPQVR
jgi:hypothetical protein